MHRFRPGLWAGVVPSTEANCAEASSTCIALLPLGVHEPLPGKGCWIGHICLVSGVMGSMETTCPSHLLFCCRSPVCLNDVPTTICFEVRVEPRPLDLPWRGKISGSVFLLPITNQRQSAPRSRATSSLRPIYLFAIANCPLTILNSLSSRHSSSAVSVESRQDPLRYLSAVSATVHLRKPRTLQQHLPLAPLTATPFVTQPTFEQLTAHLSR